MLAKDKAKDLNGFKAVFTTPKSAYDADGFFNTKTPEAFVPYINLMNLAKNMDGTEQQSANMLAKDKAKDPNGFKAVFTTPKSAYDADGFFNTKTPEAFVPYMNLDQARTAIVTTPAKAVELLQMNNQLESPYQVKGAYLI